VQNLESSDDHWEKSLAASAEARQQAQLVEKHSHATHAKMLAAQDATRNFDKARREHMAIQVRCPACFVPRLCAASAGACCLALHRPAYISSC